MVILRLIESNIKNWHHGDEEGADVEAPVA